MIRRQLAVLLAVVVLLTVAIPANAVCTGCYEWDTRVSGFDYCYLTCVALKPTPPDGAYCKYYGPTYELYAHYYPNADQAGSTVIKWYCVFECKYLEADTCEDFDCPPQLIPPFRQYVSREVDPCTQLCP